MDHDTDVLIEPTDDEHSDAEAAAEDTARLLMEVHDCRKAKQTKSSDQSSDSERRT